MSCINLHHVASAKQVWNLYRKKSSEKSTGISAKQRNKFWTMKRKSVKLSLIWETQKTEAVIFEHNPQFRSTIFLDIKYKNITPQKIVSSGFLVQQKRVQIKRENESSSGNFRSDRFTSMLIQADLKPSQIWRNKHLWSNITKPW